MRDISLFKIIQNEYNVTVSVAIALFAYPVCKSIKLLLPQLQELTTILAPVLIVSASVFIIRRWSTVKELAKNGTTQPANILRSRELFIGATEIEYSFIFHKRWFTKKLLINNPTFVLRQTKLAVVFDPADPDNSYLLELVTNKPTHPFTTKELTRIR